ncbi:MAG: DUF4837 family protein [Bacteroidia bacterium]|nr:DUF4837 family protein [Bacteroidia bacterium]MDW8302947.1 DUF4837 family protein [Bacteroidia bacterium]
MNFTFSQERLLSKLKKALFCGILLAVIALFAGCKSTKKKVRSQGKVGEIHILMDKRLLAHPLKSAIEEVFNMERPYQVKFVAFDNWELHKTQRNLLVVGNVNDGSAASELILSHLTEAGRENARRNLGFVKVENDTFAIPQKIVYAYSGSDSLLVERFLQKGHNLADEFRLFEQSQMHKKLYEKGFEEQLSEKLFREHGFYLKLPKNTSLNHTEPQQLSLSHPDFSCQIVYADSGQVVPQMELARPQKQHVFEFKNMKILASYTDSVAQYAFADEAQKRKYIFQYKVKSSDQILAVQTIFATFENAPEHNARLKIKNFK